jgi:hypothetical protein
MHLFATSTSEEFPELGSAAAAVDVEPAKSGGSEGPARQPARSSVKLPSDVRA